MIGSVLGGYRLEERLGQGAFGVVYRARHVDSDWVMAVKVARDTRFGEMLRQEGKLLSRLKHPNVVRLYHMDSTEDPPYVVMEYVQGQSLVNVLREGPMAPSLAADITGQVLRGLRAAHELGILHRDIKPSNILIAGDGTVKLADFGLGRVVAEENLKVSQTDGALAVSLRRSQVSQTGDGDTEMVGTIAYMSPEQLQGQHVDARSDLYSLGVVLYEALTGKLPHGRFKLPGELVSAVPRELDELVDTFLASDVDDRPPDADAALTILLGARSGVAGEGSADSEAQTAAVGREDGTPQVMRDVVGALSAGVAVKVAAVGREPRSSSPVNAWEREGSDLGEEIVGPHGGKLVWVPAGEFMMGSKLPWWLGLYEGPVHEVELDGFWIGKTEVTVSQWRAVMGSVPRRNTRGDDHPVVNVSWKDCQEFCRKTGLSLPTEAQWEYAARGPESRELPWGDRWDKSKCCNSENRGKDGWTFPVGSFQTGASWCGALDLAGNVWEWCADWYQKHYYKDAPSMNPTGPSSGSRRVLRGGAWRGSVFDCRSSNRGFRNPVSGGDYFGFRVSRSCP